jgi:hypothetical protein
VRNTPSGLEVGDVAVRAQAQRRSHPSLGESLLNTELMQPVGQILVRRILVPRKVR